MDSLVVDNGIHKGTVYPLRREEIIIGRTRECDVYLSDKGVSHRHSRLRNEKGTWVLEDLGSRNGTLVNGKRVDRARLAPGDRIRMGRIVLVLGTADPEAVAGQAGAPGASLGRPGGPEGRDLDAAEQMGATAVVDSADMDTPAEGFDAVDPSAPGAAESVAAEGDVVAEPAEAEIATKPGEQVTGEAARQAEPRRRVDVPRPTPRPKAGRITVKLDPREAVGRLAEARQKILGEVRKVIVGQSEIIDELLIGLFSRGHCLMVGVPGLAKTLMVRTLAATLDLEFKRIQFTPDLMPADITGTDVLEEDPTTRSRSYKFIRGPIFTNILLADEINRTPPKTQAALLEAMQEYRVTASGYTYEIAPPFFVLATQNPIEQEGTYPLPEAQLDRFMFNILIDYPNRDEEVAILQATTYDEMPQPMAVLNAGEILALQGLIRRVPVSEYILYYAADLARSSRPGRPGAPKFIETYVSWGAGPRAAQCLVLGAKARAIIQGRINVSAADVRSVAKIVMRHRIFLNFHADSEGLAPDAVIDRLLAEVPEPKEFLK